MKETDNLTRGSVGRVLFRFVLPYLLSCFLQTFYGMADLFVVGLFNGPEVTAAVAAGSRQGYYCVSLYLFWRDTVYYGL